MLLLLLYRYWRITRYVWLTRVEVELVVESVQIRLLWCFIIILVEVVHFAGNVFEVFVSVLVVEVGDFLDFTDFGIQLVDFLLLILCLALTLLVFNANWLFSVIDVIVYFVSQFRLLSTLCDILWFLMFFIFNWPFWFFMVDVELGVRDQTRLMKWRSHDFGHGYGLGQLWLIVLLCCVFNDIYLALSSRFWHWRRRSFMNNYRLRLLLFLLVQFLKLHLQLLLLNENLLLLEFQLTFLDFFLFV